MEATTLDSRVTVRIFIGCLVTPELKMHLAHSLLWKEASFMKSYSQEALVETHFQNKSYVGIYASDSQITLIHVMNFQQKIRALLFDYCPKLAGIEKLSLFVFPQIFVS